MCYPYFHAPNLSKVYGIRGNHVSADPQLHSHSPQTLGPVNGLSLSVIQLKSMLPSSDTYKIYQPSKASEMNSDAP